MSSGSFTPIIKIEHVISFSDAVFAFAITLMALSIDNMLELSYYDKKRIHNLKYYTWIEQQARDIDELNCQWYDYPDYWEKIRNSIDKIDKLIATFNNRTGLLNKI